MNLSLNLSLVLLLLSGGCFANEEVKKTMPIPITSSEQFPLPLQMLYRAHPWHGIALGSQAPELVNCYVEIVPTDTVKYELDKETGLLKVDRPQKYSSLSPTLYGLLPRTYAGKQVAAYSSEKSGIPNIVGDGDPLDVCILAESVILHGDLIVRAIPVGGFRMLDGDEADDKIIAVMEGDLVFGNIKDISECPEKLINKLRHYFLTYKDVPGSNKARKVQITHTYGHDEAIEVIRRGYQDYLEYVKTLK